MTPADASLDPMAPDKVYLYMYFENNVHVEFFKEVNYFIYSCAGATIYPSFTAVEFNPNFVGVYGGDSNDDVN